MKFRYNGERLSKAVRTKRLVEMQVGLRGAAAEIGISPSILSRVENRKMPNAAALAAICDWIDIPMDYFFTPIKKRI